MKNGAGAYQFLFMSCSDRPLQANHHTRCDWLYHYIYRSRPKATNWCLRSGSGNWKLLRPLVNNSHLTIDYLDWKWDDLLIDLSSLNADDGIQCCSHATRSVLVLKESDLIVSDLPIGYHPDDAIAQRYQVASLKVAPMPITSWWNRLEMFWNLKME